MRLRICSAATLAMFGLVPLNAGAQQLEEIERGRGSGTLDLDTGPLDVTNLGKVFFPATKQTKGDLMRFYARMSPFLLPAMADRPLVMKRFPNGITGKAFYQQKAPENPPAGVRVEPVSDEGLTTADRLIGGNLATLLYLIQLGAVSVDPWHSRVQSVQFADYSIIVRTLPEEARDMDCIMGIVGD